VRHPVLSFVSGTAMVALLACCNHVQQAAAQHQEPAAPAEAGTATGTTGKVVETMNAGSYTYVQVDDGSKKIWAAAPQFAVAVGDKVVVPEGAPMENFQSKTLGRTFDVVYFVPGIQVVGGQAAGGLAAGGLAAGGLATSDQAVKDQVAAAHTAAGVAGHGASAAIAAAPVDLSNIKKAEGGQSVAELFANKAALTGKDVLVRGRVVKFTPEVMGKNWIHVQDGTGSAGSNDLTISTGATAAVGNTVLVRGKLVTDRDLGAGYHYDVIIEDGTVSVE
jgi:hypothetical protein